MDITKREITKIARETGKFTVRTLRADGIGTGEFDVIHVIWKNPGTTQSDICRILGIDKGACAREVNNLEAKGYIRRESNPEDGRSQLIYATAKAEKLKISKVEVEAAFYTWLLEDLDEEDKEAFAEILDVLYHKCKNESKAGFPHMQERIQKTREEKRSV